MHRRNVHWSEIIANKEDVRVVWLDTTIDDTPHSVAMQKTLLKLNPAAQFYTDCDRCMNMIKSTIGEQILFIVSNDLIPKVSEQIRQFQSIVAVFVICTSQQQQAVGSDSRIRQVTNQDSLFSLIFQNISNRRKERVSFSLFHKRQNSLRNLSKGSGSFLWHQVLVYVLKQLPQDKQSKDDMLNQCRDYYQFNEIELQQIENFRNNYNPNEAITWYTKESFVYRLVNRALRTEDLDLLYSFRFFITDLCSQIEKQKMIHEFPSVLYRGQFISIEELELLKQNVKSIISINGFLSTSRNIDVACLFTDSMIASDKYASVLFEIYADVAVKTAVFTDVSDRGAMSEEQEVLFTLNSLFQILSVELDSQQTIWTIKLATTDQGTELIDQYMEYIKQEMDFSSPMIYFGRLLTHELAQTDRAEKYFNMLLETSIDDYSIIASVHQWLGVVHHKRGQLSSALDQYQLAHNIRTDHLVADHPHNALSYYNLGAVAEDTKDYTKALENYEKALDIWERYPNSPDSLKAEIVKKIGMVYRKQGDLNKALQYLSRALEIFRQCLHPQHPQIAMCFRELGFVDLAQNNFDEALANFFQKLEIDEQSLPSDHHFHPGDVQCIVEVYKLKHEPEMALAFCQKKLDAHRNNLGKNHPRAAQILMIMAKLLINTDASQACEYHMEALLILHEFASVDRQAVSDCLNFMERLHLNYETHECRLKCCTELLKLHREILPSDHIDIANTCKKVASCYQNMNDIPNSLSYWNQGLLIYQTRYGAEHEAVRQIQSHINKLKKRMQKFGSGRSADKKTTTG